MSSELKARQRLCAIGFAMERFKTEKPSEYEVQVCLDDIDKAYEKMTPEEKTNFRKEMDELSDRAKQQL